MPRYDELPAIDLYMDQVVAILEDCLRLFLRDAQEKRITPAMINNYVKLKVLPPPVKKRYTRDHLCQLILICLLKQVLSIPDIALLVGSLWEDSEADILHDTFCAAQKAALSEVCDRVSETAPRGETDLKRLALALAIEANARRIAAERILSELEKSDEP